MSYGLNVGLAEIKKGPALYNVSKYRQPCCLKSDIYFFNEFPEDCKFPCNMLISLNHVTNNSQIATMARQMASQWSQFNQFMAIPHNTVLMIFSQIGPLVFLETCLQA